VSFIAVIAVVLTALAVLTLWWQLHAWRTPETLTGTGFGGDPTAPELSFSLLVPARHETAVLAATLERLATSDHPDVEVIAIIGHDDDETRAVADAVARRHPERVRVVIDHTCPSAAATWSGCSTPRTRSTRGCCAASTRRFAAAELTSCRVGCS